MSQAISSVRIIAGGGLLIAAAMGIGRFAYTPLLPPMQLALGWSVAQAGDVASANYLGYVLGALLASWLSQRSPAAPWLFAGMIATALTTALGMITVSFPGWLMLRFASGVASALCMVFAAGLIMNFFAQRGRNDLGTAYLGGVGGGIVLSVLVIEAAAHAGAGVPLLWAALGACAAVMTVVSAVLLAPALRQVPQRPGPGPVVPLPPDRGTLNRHIVAYGLFGFGYIITATFLVAMARTVRADSLLEPASWLVVGLLAAPSVWFWQRMAIRFRISSALRVAYLLEAVGVLLAGFGGGPLAVLAGGALLGATFAGITAVGLSAARLCAGTEVARALGLMTAAFGAGQLLGPLVAGRLAALSGGFELPSLLAAVLLVTGAALLREQREPAPG